MESLTPRLPSFTVLRLLVALCLSPALRGAPGFEAGAAKIDITPSGPIRLSGYGSRAAVSEGVDQRLFARALVLKDAGGVLSVILSVDAIGMPARVRDRVVGEIRDETGIYHVRLAAAATHSHYAPVLDGSIVNIFAMSPEETRAVKAYTNELVLKLVKAIGEALAKLAPAEVLHGKGTAGFAKNRRQQGGPVEHDVPVLLVKGADGKPVAVVYGYACHATTIPAELNRVCGDWPGYAAEYIEEAQPGAVALPLIGCGADANPSPRGEFAISKQHGRELADAVERVLAGPLKALPAKTDAQFEYVPLKFEHVPSREELEAQLASGPEHVRRRARLLLDQLARDGSLSESYNYAVQVLSFGDDLVMVFLAGEVVVDYSIRLKKELAPRNLWVAAYTNDIPCYIPSRRVLAEGGYEADDSMIWYGRPSKWDPSIEDAIVEKVKALIPQGPDAALSRIKPAPPVSPREALATFRLPEGLRIELAAAEPEVTDPVQIAFDEEGRMYAAEMRDYPLGPGRGKPSDGRVRVLEDRDLDGYFERSSVLADELPYCNGIACADGGVFVTAVPNIVFLKDTDGDGKADVRRVVYSGFGPGNSQHLVNTLAWGPDGWIHVNGGDVATVHCLVRPEVPDLPLLHANLRFHPRTLRTEAATGYRGGFGIAFDELGSRFACDNQNHAAHVVFERGDISRNPDLRIDDTMNEITDHGAKVYPISKTLERYNDPQDYGRFSSACGIHVYGGDALPPEYRGSHFVCEPVSNLVHRDVLVPSGASYSASRGEKTSEFLASTDHWFRPVSCTTGPEGALYVADMYREVIEHPQWIPEHIQKLFDLQSGMDRGRIYRVTAAVGDRKKPKLARASTEALAADLSHSNAWRRSTAQRLIVERGHAGAEAPVLAVLGSSPDPLGRLHALWTLSGLGKLGDQALRRALEDPFPAVRAAGVRLAAGFPVFDELLPRLAQDADPRVRFQTALAAGTADPSLRTAVLAKIAVRDAADPWTRTAVLASAGDLVPILRAALEGGADAPGRGELVRRTLSLIGTRKRPAELVSALGFLLEKPSSAPWRVPALSALLEPLGEGDLAKALDDGSAPASLRSSLDAVLAEVAERAKDDAADIASRAAALNLVGHAASPASEKLLGVFLDPRYPPDLQSAAVKGLARSSRAEVASDLVAVFPGLTPLVRGEALDVLLRDPARTGVLLDALESGAIRPVEVDLARRTLLVESSSEAIRGRAEKVFASVVVDRDRAAVVERYRKAIAMPEVEGGADLRNGEALFLKNCATCHRVGDKGIPVGADLSGMKSREADALVTDILDPSRAVAPEFVNYVCVTRDGQVLNGLLASETPSSIVLRRAEGKSDSVLRRDIAELRATDKSVMPEGLEQEIDPRGLRDVIRYVRGGFEEIARIPLQGGGGNGPPDATGSGERRRLKESLTFHVSFDSGPDADFARGDPKVYTGKELGLDAKPGLTTGNVRIAKDRGRFGDALELKKKDPVFVFYRAEKNVDYKKSDWSGTVSFWLSLDPDRDLEPGYCDPVNITERGWNDGALFADFTKDDSPRHFRMGIFADREVWDPKKREWDEVPAAERPMVDVVRPPFGSGKWTHVLFTWTAFNTGKEDGVAKFYLNGEVQGSLSGRRQTFTWDPARAVIHIGMYYIGLFDDLAIFDRALSPEEVGAFYRLEGGVKALKK